MRDDENTFYRNNNIHKNNYNFNNKLVDFF